MANSGIVYGMSMENERKKYSCHGVVPLFVDSFLVILTIYRDHDSLLVYCALVDADEYEKRKRSTVQIPQVKNGKCKQEIILILK